MVDDEADECYWFK